MNRKLTGASLLTVVLLMAAACVTGGSAMSQSGNDATIVELPEPSIEGTMSIEQCLAARRSVREYADHPLTLDDVSQILWAAQGITAEWGGRTAPSAGALNPIFIYLVAENIDGLAPGSWEYSPQDHSLELVIDGHILADLAQAALGQECVADASAVLAITAVPEITMARYGDRSMRYIDQEVGCVCQNVYLQCASLGLGTVSIGAFHDDNVAEIVGTEAECRLIMPIGALEQ